MSEQPPSWYIRGEGNQPAGPFTADDLMQSWRTGRLLPDTLCWREGMTQWLPLAQVEPFASAIQSAGLRPRGPKASLIAASLGGGIAIVAIAAAVLVILLRNEPETPGKGQPVPSAVAKKKGGPRDRVRLKMPSPTGPVLVSGTVTLRQEVLVRAEVTFHPTTNEATMMSSKTDERGHFSSSVLPGEYRVTITLFAYEEKPMSPDEVRQYMAREGKAPPAPIATNVVPAKYASPQTSPLTAMVGDRSGKPLQFDIE